MTAGNFSERHGLTQRPALRPESMDEPLRTGLWNVLLARLFGKIAVNQYGEITSEYHVFINLQRNFFKLPMDEFEKHLASRREWYKDAFATMEWWRVYDFVEFVARRMIPYDSEEWVRDVNAVLEAENAAWRLAGESVVPVSSGEASALKETLVLAEAHDAADVVVRLKAGLAAIAARRYDGESVETRTPAGSDEAGAAAAVWREARAALEAAARYVVTGTIDEAGRGSPQGAADGAAHGAAHGESYLTLVLDDSSLGLALGLRAAARSLFGPEAAPPDKLHQARAALIMASACVGCLVDAAVETGRLPARTRVAPRPIPADPWGENSARRK
jgi:hypothetical protein